MPHSIASAAPENVHVKLKGNPSVPFKVCPKYGLVNFRTAKIEIREKKVRFYIIIVNAKL